MMTASHLWGWALSKTLCSSILYFTHSTGMKRLTYGNEEEFGTAPNKMARMDEPKKGIAAVLLTSQLFVP